MTLPGRPNTGRVRVIAEDRLPSDKADDKAQAGARDAQLVAATLSGDRAAFGTLVSSYQRRLYGLCYRYVRNEAAAADLTQRAFLKAFESIHKLQRGEAFAAWLFRIAVNLAKNEIRFHATKQFQDIEDTPLATHPDREGEMDRAAQQRMMRGALEQLPPKQRQCVLLRIDGDLPFREIGQTVGCSEASARVNFHHGLKALKKALSPSSEQVSE